MLSAFGRTRLNLSRERATTGGSRGSSEDRRQIVASSSRAVSQEIGLKASRPAPFSPIRRSCCERACGRVILALGIARHLCADDTTCVGLGCGLANPPETAPVDPLDLERAGARGVCGHTLGTMSSGEDRIQLDPTEYRDELAGSRSGKTAPLFAARRNHQFYLDSRSTKS